jgi:tetratricopeptide (TPR) repeat protein
MRRHFVFCELLVICAYLSPLALDAPSIAQAQVVPYTIRRVEPPTAGASAEELENAGDQLRSEEALPNALDFYRAALGKKPNNAVLYNKLGIVELQMQRYKEARRDFEKAIKVDRTFASLYNNLGTAYYGQQKYRAALKQYQKAIKLDPGVAAFYVNMGAAYTARKEFETADIHYARALKLDPDILERQSRTGLSTQLTSSEDVARFAFVLAKLYARTGAIDRSLAYLKRAIEEDYKGIEEVYKDSAFTGLRKDPRFADLMSARTSALTGQAQ